MRIAKDRKLRSNQANSPVNVIEEKTVIVIKHTVDSTVGSTDGVECTVPSHTCTVPELFV